LADDGHVAYVHSSVVPAPLDDVFAWHERPGALARLLPPWQPASVIDEAASLRDGQAVLGLPLGLRWVARHRDYDRPYRFVDELTSLPLRWHHQHEFAEAALSGPPSTRVIDRVTTWVPARLLAPVFRYRHRQLADDIAAHQWAAARGVRPMTVAVTGSSGLVGSALSAFLTTGGHRVIRLVRHSPTARDRLWRPDAPAADLLDGVDAVVHLAGASIAGRFTSAHRAEIRDSRVEPTRHLAELAARQGVRAFVAASAIGYYGPDRGDEWLTEDSERGSGFLADVVAAWEAAAAVDGDARVVSVRTGIVQSPRGGVLRLQRAMFQAGLGGRLGSGAQWLSWIGIDDLVDVYHRALVDDDLTGPVNAVAPTPVRNVDYTDILARVLHRPAVLPVPALGPRLLLGREGARELVEASQRVRPAELLATGHRFRFPDLEPALRHLLGR
jgi:uncharacterized protein (TIGR01777 family)